MLTELNLMLSKCQAYIQDQLKNDDNGQTLRKEFYKTVFKQTADKLLQTKTLIQQGTEIVDYLTADEEDLTLDQKRIKREYQWRMSLKKGDKLDATLQKQIPNNRVVQWARATVYEVLDSDQIYISFVNQTSVSNILVSRLSTDIAFPNTYTDDIDWKYDIKEGDIFDSLDGEAIWYRSTCLDVRTLKQQSSQDEIEPTSDIKEVYVGYRIYDEEEGHKWDDDGRKFIGWSNKYDEWISVTSPTIQRLNTMVKEYQVVGKSYMLYDVVVDDLQDVIYNTKERKKWAVFRNNFFSNLKCIPDYFNEFGAKKGFEKILDFLSTPDPSKKTTLRHLYLLMDFLSKSQPLWQHQFMCYYVPRLKEAAETAILYTNDQGTGPTQLKFSKESLLGFQKALQSILRRFYTQEKYSLIMAELNFNIGFSLLKSEKLEQKIQGIKEVIEQIRATKFSVRKTISARDIMRKLKSENIFETIFGDNYHIQLIQRSQDIIKFYINEKEITEKEIDQIWQATKKDQQTKMEIYKIIQELAIMFKNDEIEMLVERFAQVPPDQFVEKEIECVYELSKYSYKLQTFSVRAAQLFWDIAVQERAYKKQIIEIAMDKFIDLIRNWDRDQKYDFINRCIKKIVNHQSPVQCIKIIQKILEQIPNYKVNGQPTLYDMSQNLIRNDDLINIVIYDFIAYNDAINELWNKGQLNESNIDSVEVLNLPFSHRQQSFIRLSFVKQMLQNSQQLLEEEQLDQIWDLMLVRSKISIDADIFFNWFKQLLGDQNKLSPELILNFFQTKVCGKDVSFKYLKKAGFDCICNIFLKINEQEDNLQVLQMPSNNSHGIQQKLDFKVHVPPLELIGIDLLWKLLTECDKKNVELTAAVIDLITKVYHNLSPNLENMIHDIEDQFCKESLNRLQNFITNPESTEEDKKQIVRIITIMMKSFFQDSEKNGIGKMKPHIGIVKGTFIEKLIIQNNITNQKNTPKYIELNVYSNMTIWQLKKLVAERLKQSPLRIQFNRPDVKKKQINDSDHQLMLRDFRIESYELIYVQKKPLIFQARTMLLNKKKELVPEVKEIFESWFEKFSDSEGFMTPETCVEFIRNSTQDQTVLISDHRITRLFNEYDSDLDGRITREDFLNFYKVRSIEKPDLVWSNLNLHGYGNDLKPLNSQYLQDDPNEIKDPSVLPRFKLSNQQNMFNEIFGLLDKVQGPAQDDLWTFITNLRTNPFIYSKLLSLSSISEIVEDNSVHKLLYNLQILESFIIEYSTKKTAEIKCYFNENQEYNNQFPSIENQQNSNQSTNFNSSNIQVDTLNEQSRDIQNAAPQSGIAIPLPVGNPISSNGDDMHGSNIPEPPQNSGQFIGPMAPVQGVNFNVNLQQNKNRELLESFRGHIVAEPYIDDIFSDEEIASHLGITEMDEIREIKHSWIQSFVSNDGFKILLQFLKKIIAHTSNRPDQEIFKQSAEKECLHQIMKIMKLLLLSSFIANSPSVEFTQEIQRKMSQKQDQADNFDIEGIIDNLEPITVQIPFVQQNNVQDKKQEVKKNAIQLEQEDTQKQFEPLIDILRGVLGQKILESIDFKAFQEQILAIIQMILKKKDKLVGDDKANVDQALSLWISVIIYNQDLLQYIYDNQESSQAKDEQSIIEVLIDQGLLCGNYSIRESFKDSFKFIFQSVKTQTLHEAPYIFFIKVLIKNVSLVEFRSRESKQFFLTLRLLFEQYFDAQRNNKLGFIKILDTRELIQEFIIRLTTYESREKKNQFLEDTNLVGYLNILQELIKDDPSSLEFDEYRNLALYLIEKCLFTFSIEPLAIHITKDVDIQAYEKPFINKCLITDSRIAGYGLLQTLCTYQPDLIGEIIQKYLYPLLFKVQKPKKVGFAPRHEGRSYYGYCGMKNLGCICYMNAMIQQFFHIPTFRYCLLATQDNQPPNWQDFENEKVDDNMLHQLMKLMGFLELSERQDYNPREFCFSFKDFAGQPTNVRIQQDSQEFLNLAFDRLENLLANTSQKYLLQNIFGGQTCSLMICKSCGNLRQRKEVFYNLSLEVKNQKSIYDGLKKFVSGEIINEFQCEACNQRVDVERKTVIESLPNMLIVHLQRIVFDYDSFQNQKLNSRVEFPNVLNLKPYMLSEVMKQEKDLLKKAKKDKRKQDKLLQKQNSQKLVETLININKEEGKIEEGSFDQVQLDKMELISDSQPKNEVESSSDDENEDKDDDMEADELDEPEENFQYKLVGVVVHMGTADAGHYISYININRGQKDEESPEWLQTEKEKWLEFNDSTVKDYKQVIICQFYRFINLEEDCFGGVQNSNNIHSQSDMKSDYSRNAYMLIYEKRRKEQIKIVIPKNLINQSQSSSSLDCDGTAISRDSPKDHLFYVVPQLQERLQSHQGILFDEEIHEHYAKVDFNSAQKFVPNDIYRQVHTDNHLFLCEKQIFSNSFFETTKALVETLVAKTPQILQENEPSNSLIFDFLKRLIFDLLSMTSENKQLLDMTKLLLNMVNLNESQLLKIIDEHILVDKSKLGKDQKTFLENLISNMDKDMRDMNQLILTFVVNKLFQLNNMDMIDTIMNQVFALIPEDLTKNWLKIQQILGVSYYQFKCLQFLFDVTRCGYQQICYMVKNNLISKLIDFYLENESPHAIDKKRQIMGSNYASPPLENLILNISYILRNYPNIRMELDEEGMGLNNSQEFNYVSPMYMGMFQLELPPLSQEDIFMLSQKAFYAKNLKAGYERQEFGRLITQLSYGNFKFSRRVCKKILVGINKASSDEVEPYLHALVPLLILSDQYRLQRFEWLLGMAQLKVDKSVMFSHEQSQTVTKLGVSLIEAANDDVYEYKSTLFFKQTTGIKESFLQILYQFRKRWAKYSFSCLLSILNACQQDPSGMILHYLKTLEPPNYTYGRYIDWIMPYIQDQIDQINKSSSQTSKQELIIAIQAKTMLESLLEKPQPQVLISTKDNLQDLNIGQDQPHTTAMEQIQSNSQDQATHPNQIYHYDSTDGGPELYLLWNVLQETIIKEEIFFDQNIKVIVKELNVKITESKPDGLTNRVFPPNQFFNLRFNDNGKREIGNNQGNNYVGNRRRQTSYGRGNNPQYMISQKAQGQTVMIAPKRNPLGRKGVGQKKKKKTYITSIQSAPQDDYQDNGGNNQDADTMVNYDKEEEYQNQDDSMEVEFEEDNQDQSEYFSEDNGKAGINNRYEGNGHTVNGNGVYDPQEMNVLQDLDVDTQNQYQGIVPEVNFNEPVVNQNPFDNDIQQDQHYIQQDSQNQIPQDHQQLGIEAWETATQCVLVFTIVNLDLIKPQNVILSFRDASEKGDPPINIKIPRSSIPSLIMGGKERDIVVFTKLRPFEEWGKYEYQVNVQHHQQNDSNYQGYHNLAKVGFVTNIPSEDNIVGTHVAIGPIMQDSNVGSNHGYDEMMDAQLSNEKECPSCTFLNSSYLNFCEICQNPI